jgi:hypothetical protein
MMKVEMLDGADRADRPSWGRYLMMAMLIVWALVCLAVVLTAPYVDVLIAILIVSALVIVAAVLIGHYPIIGTLTVALGVVAVFVGLLFLRNALRTVPVDPAYPGCSAENLESLAESLGTQPTAEAVARAYVPWARHWGYSGTYEDCLQGFRAKR